MLTPHRALIDALVQCQRRLGATWVRVTWDFEHAGALDAATAAGVRDVATGLPPARLFWELLSEVAELVDARNEGRIDTVTVWSFHNRLKLALLLYHGVDGIMTDRPAVLRVLWRLASAPAPRLPKHPGRAHAP